MKSHASQLVVAIVVLIFTANVLAQKSERDFVDLSLQKMKSSNMDYDGAIAVLSECVRKHPKSVKCYAIRASTYSGKKDFVRAVADYAEAIRLRPDDDSLYSNRGFVYYSDLQNYEAAIADYTAVLRLKPADSSALLSRGMAYHKKGDYDKAIADLTQSLELELKKEESEPGFHYVNRAKAYCDLGKTELAAQDEARALAAGSKISAPCGGSNVAVGNVPKPEAAPVETPAPTAESQVKSRSFKESFDLGNEQLGNKDYAAAIRSFSECIRLSPKQYECFFNRGIAYVSLRDDDSAIKDYTETIRLKPTFEPAYSRRQAAYVRQGNYGAALADLEIANKLKPNDPDIKKALSAVKELKESLDQLTPEQKKAVEFFKIGMQYLKEKKYVEAIDAFNSCYSMVPEPDCLEQRALTYKMQGNYPAALEDYTLLIRMYNDPKYYYLRGLLYLEENSRERAAADFRKALELNPNLTEAKQKLQELETKP